MKWSEHPCRCPPQHVARRCAGGCIAAHHAAESHRAGRTSSRQRRLRTGGAICTESREGSRAGCCIVALLSAPLNTHSNAIELNDQNRASRPSAGGIFHGRLHCFLLLILSPRFENVPASGGRSHRLATAEEPGPQAIHQQWSAVEGLRSTARCVAHLSISPWPWRCHSCQGSTHQQRHCSALPDCSRIGAHCPDIAPDGPSFGGSAVMHDPLQGSARGAMASTWRGRPPARDQSRAGRRSTPCEGKTRP